MKSTTIMTYRDPNRFFREAFATHGSIRRHVILHVLFFGIVSTVILFASDAIEMYFRLRIVLEVAPYEVAGAALGLLLVLRTNAGYDRWWEGRKLWGAIVNQSRNFVIGALSYGPDDPEWRERIVRWTATFPHVARCSLRDEPPCSRIIALVGVDEAAAIAKSAHMPSYVSARLAEQLREACDRHAMNSFAFLQLDKERALLIDDIGACERILKSPLPVAYSIETRRFLALFLLMLPLVLLHHLEAIWMIPFITMIVAYPLLAIDQIGIELQNPFVTRNLCHLPLDEICETIERNVTGMLQDQRAMSLDPAVTPTSDSPS